MRSAGILLHPTSLPGPGPCGDLGDGAIWFLDWLQAAGCTLWQVLPLNPPGAGLSPYDSPGAFAAGTHLLSLEQLLRVGLLRRDEVHWPHRAPERVDRFALRDWHGPLVDRAARRLVEVQRDAVDQFRHENGWVEEWALYRAIVRDAGVLGWWELTPGLRDRHGPTLGRARHRLQAEVDGEVAAQLLFRQQWDRVHQAARQRGIRIVGDMPIFVSGGGSDVWARRDLFRGASGPDGAWRPNPVTGVPPDYFSPLGQRWGNPHYDWERHAEEGFAWWIGRIRSSLQLVDLLRVDHFRGFVAAWEIPADEQDARRGAWRAAPGAVLFQAVRQALGNLPLIAEDLGLITPDVIELRDTLGLPGMKILQFAFGDDPSHPFLPHNWTHPNWVAYTGTHDNDTARGWYHTADADSRHRYRVYCGRDGGEPGWDLIRLAWSSIASMAIAPLQDALSLDGWSRMNTPGLAEGNWSWRVVDLPDHAARRLRELGECYGRLPVAKESP